MAPSPESCVALPGWVLHSRLLNNESCGVLVVGAITCGTDMRVGANTWKSALALFHEMHTFPGIGLEL